MPVDLLQDRMTQTKLPDSYHPLWNRGDDFPAVENPKDHFLYQRGITKSDFLQENWSRIILLEINNLPAHDQYSPKWIEFSTPATTENIELNIQQIATLFPLGGQSAVVQVLRAMQEQFEDSDKLSDLRNSLEAAMQNNCDAFVEDQNSEDSQRSFFKRVIRLDKLDQTDAALDLLYDSIDELMRNGEFHQLDSFISEIEVDKYSVDILLGILTATLPARSKLPSRRIFFNKIDRSIKDRGEEEEGLLTGLQ